MRERSSLDLRVGPVGVVLDFLQGWGPSGIMFSDVDQMWLFVDRVH